MKNLKTLKIKSSGLDQGLVHYTVHCNIQKSVNCDRLTSAEVTQDAVREAALKLRIRKQSSVKTAVHYVTTSQICYLLP